MVAKITKIRATKLALLEFFKEHDRFRFADICMTFQYYALEFPFLEKYYAVTIGCSILAMAWI
jgi:hypothetical protein